MVPILSLWLPIVLSAVIVFFVSFVVHMVLPFHKNDYRKLAAEDPVMDALRGFDIPPGDYMMPRPSGPAEMKSGAYKARMARGPVAMMTFYAPGRLNMGGSLAQWFAYSLLVGVFAAYVAGRALGPGAQYLAVFRFAGVTAFLGYGLALLQESIWYKKNWGTTLRNQCDALLYALLTAGAFGWLWPRG